MHQSLGSGPETAYGLARRDDGTVLLTEMMGTWNTIDPHKKHGLEDLPDFMRREHDRVISDVDFPSIRLGTDDIIKESFRLSSIKKAPDEEGWFNASDIIRVARGIGRQSGLDKRSAGADFVATLRTHPLIENKLVRDTLYFRPRVDGPEILPSMVETRALFGQDEKERKLPDQHSFGSAYRAIHGIDHTLVSHGTKVIFTRDHDTKSATFDAGRMTWTMEDGSPMKRVDPDDPVLHHYTNGWLVGALVGFVSRSSSGRIYVNVGIPYDSPEDEDASIPVQYREEYPTYEEALTALTQRDDLDHVFSRIETHKPMLGFWLTCLTDVDE